MSKFILVLSFLCSQLAWANGTTSKIVFANVYEGGPNLIKYGDFENALTTGWSLGTIGTLTNGLPTGSPTFGSGASGNLSIATGSGSSAIDGSYSLTYASSAASTAGNMVATSNITLDKSAEGTVLAVHFDYGAVGGGSANINWSGTSSNSFAWAVYDVTNSAWLSSVGNFCMMQSTGVATCNGASFQTASNTTTIRFVFYNANASSGIFNISLDDFALVRQVIPSGYAGTDWVAYTPTLTGFGTPSNVYFYSRRVGDSLEVQGLFDSGTSTAVTAQATLGYNGGNGNVTINTSKLTTNSIVGYGGFSVSGVAASTVLATGAVDYLEFGTQTSSTAGLSAINANVFTASGTYFSFYALVPIVGWSSNTQISADTQSTVTAGAAVGATATVTSSYSNITWTTINNDTNGAFSAASSATGYTIPFTGFYDIIGQAYVSATTITAGNQFTIGLYNSTGSSTLRETEYVYQGTNTTSEAIPFNYQQVYLNAGTLLNIQIKSNTTSPVITSSSTQNFLSIGKRAGSNAVQAPPTVAFDYYGSGQTITTTPSAMINPTKLTDTMGLMNTSTGLYPAPYTGTYHCDCRVAYTHSSSDYVALNFYVAGSAVGTPAFGSPGTTTYEPASISDELPILAGQTIGCYANTGSTSTSGIGGSSFSCHRLGY